MRIEVPGTRECFVEGVDQAKGIRRDTQSVKVVALLDVQ